MKIEIEVPDGLVRYISEHEHALPPMCNFRTAGDGLVLDGDSTILPGDDGRTHSDGPPFEVWHTGGCGGCLCACDRAADAEAFCAAMEIVSTAVKARGEEARREADLERAMNAATDSPPCDRCGERRSVEAITGGGTSFYVCDACR